MADLKKQKQEYLKVNILEAGYDVHIFGEFMSSKKENGTDINEWEFAELENLVHEFQILQDNFNSHTDLYHAPNPYYQDYSNEPHHQNTEGFNDNYSAQESHFEETSGSHFASAGLGKNVNEFSPIGHMEKYPQEDNYEHKIKILHKDEDEKEHEFIKTKLETETIKEGDPKKIDAENNNNSVDEEESKFRRYIKFKNFKVIKNE